MARKFSKDEVLAMLEEQDGEDDFDSREVVTAGSDDELDALDLPVDIDNEFQYDYRTGE